LKTVIVELMQNQQSLSYQEVSLAEAKEILARRMVNGHRWRVPEWQFETDGSRPSVEKYECALEAYRQIRESI
jgi:hypothetical protein